MPRLDSVAYDAHHVMNILRRVYPDSVAVPSWFVVLINDDDGGPLILQARLPPPPTFGSNAIVIHRNSQTHELNQIRTVLNIQLTTLLRPA